MTDTGSPNESGFTLLLPDELFLLSLDEASGAFPSEVRLQQGLAGAALLELALQGRLAPDGRAAFLIIDSTDDPDQLITTLLRDLQSSPGNRFLKFWITQPTAFPGLAQRLFTRHTSTGLLLTREKNFLSVVGAGDKYAFSQPESLEAVLAHLNDAAQSEELVDDRTFALFKLIQATLPLLGHLLDADAWTEQTDPRIDTTQYDTVLIENICNVIRNTLQSSP